MSPDTAPPVGSTRRPELRLDHNERLRPPPEITALLPRVPAGTLCRYPSPAGLERRLARRWSVAPERVLATAGADDALDRVCRAFLATRPALVSVDPTFEMIPRFARLAGGRVVRVPHLEGPAPMDALLGAVEPDTGLVAVITPHNPTGAITPCGRLVELADALSAPVRLLVDLAYVDFADQDPTAALLRRPRVVLVRTLSKAWGLAGLRVGAALGSPDDILRLRDAGPPFPLAGPSLWLAEAAVAAGERLTAPYVAAVRRERRALSDLLRELGGSPLPSEANFVLASIPGARRVRDGLASRGIRVRAFDHLPDMLRFTLPGDPGSFDRLRTALRSTLATGDVS